MFHPCHMTSSRDRDDRWKCDRAGSPIEHLEHVMWTHQTDYKSIIHFSISNLGLTFAHSECHPVSQPFLTSRNHVIERKFILDLELIFQFIHIHSDFRISLKIKFLKSFFKSHDFFSHVMIITWSRIHECSRIQRVLE